MGGKSMAKASFLSVDGAILAKVVTLTINANSPMANSCHFNNQCKGSSGQNCSFDDRCRSYRFNDLCQGSDTRVAVQMSNVGGSVIGDTISMIDAEGLITKVAIPAPNASCPIIRDTTMVRSD